MNKLIACLLFLNVTFIILNGGMAGGGGIATTSLTVAATASTDTLNVADTTGFLTSDVIVIGSEQIAYTGKTAVSFTGCSRGYNSTVAATHKSGAQVRTQETDLLNQSLGFNVASTSSTIGAFGIVALGTSFLGHALINLVIWDYPNIFQGDLVYLRLAFIAMSVGVIVTFAIQYLLPAIGVLKK